MDDKSFVTLAIRTPEKDGKQHYELKTFQNQNVGTAQEGYQMVGYQDKILNAGEKSPSLSQSFTDPMDGKSYNLTASFGDKEVKTEIKRINQHQFLGFSWDKTIDRETIAYNPEPQNAPHTETGQLTEPHPTPRRQQTATTRSAHEHQDVISRSSIKQAELELAIAIGGGKNLKYMAARSGNEERNGIVADGEVGSRTRADLHIFVEEWNQTHGQKLNDNGKLDETKLAALDQAFQEKTGHDFSTQLSEQKEVFQQFRNLLGSGSQGQEAVTTSLQLTGHNPDIITTARGGKT